MSTRAAARVDPRPDAPPRARPAELRVARRRRRRGRVRLRLGLLTIPLFALLFSGVVYVNSAELALIKRQGQVARQTAEVQEQIARLRASQNQMDVAVRARADRMGMFRPKSDDLRYIEARGVAPTP